MKAIVAATGLSSKTVYGRYPNKAALLRAAQRHLLRRAGNEQAAALTDVFREDLYAFLLKGLQGVYGAGTASLARLLQVESAFAEGMRAEIAGAVDRAFIAPMIWMLDVAKAAGTVRAIDSERIARAVSAMLISEPSARLLAGLSAPDAAEIETQARFLTDFVLDGVCGAR